MPVSSPEPSLVQSPQQQMKEEKRNSPGSWLSRGGPPLACFPVNEARVHQLPIDGPHRPPMQRLLSRWQVQSLHRMAHAQHADLLPKVVRRCDGNSQVRLLVGFPLGLSPKQHGPHSTSHHCHDQSHTDSRHNGDCARLHPTPAASRARW
eukprot:scaffold240831_cov42-Prasinocladus_malaysianus.AAC.1